MVNGQWKLALALSNKSSIQITFIVKSPRPQGRVFYFYRHAELVSASPPLLLLLSGADPESSSGWHQYLLTALKIKTRGIPQCHPPSSSRSVVVRDITSFTIKAVLYCAQKHCAMTVFSYTPHRNLAGWRLTFLFFPSPRTQKHTSLNLSYFLYTFMQMHQVYANASIVIVIMIVIMKMKVIMKMRVKVIVSAKHLNSLKH